MTTGKVIEAKILGGPETAQRFRDKSSRLREMMRATMADLGAQLKSRGEAAAPRRAPGRSKWGKTGGKLAGSFKLKLLDRAMTIGAQVRVRQFYGLIVEQGYGPIDERVRGYVRRDPRSTLFKMTKRGVLGKRMLAQGIVYVRPFNRTGRAAPHPFLIPQAQQMWPDVKSRAEAVVEIAMED